MEQLLETGFKGRELDLVNRMINELDAIEDDRSNANQVKKMLLGLESVIIQLMFFDKTLEWVSLSGSSSARIRIELC